MSTSETSDTCACWRPTARPSNTTKSSTYSGPSCTYRSTGIPSTLIPSTISGRTLAPETPRTRSRRVFGGIDSPDGEEFTELCGPMLDVVLGLFGSVDYDDE
ncbi:hypothetical protein Q7P37_010683 [Cladosporium fusiforme]